MVAYPLPGYFAKAHGEVAGLLFVVRQNEVLMSQREFVIRDRLSGDVLA